MAGSVPRARHFRSSTPKGSDKAARSREGRRNSPRHSRGRRAWGLVCRPPGWTLLQGRAARSCAGRWEASRKRGGGARDGR